MEEEIQRDDAKRFKKAEATGRRESAIKEISGGFKFGQANAAGCIIKKAIKPEAKREAVRLLQAHYDISEVRGCKVIQMHRSTFRYESKAQDQSLLKMRIKEIASTRVRYGYKRIHILLRREGWKINHKRVYRIYREEGLNLRHKSKRKKVSGTRIPREDVTFRNECWAMDFVSDSLYNGKRFRALTIIDIYTRECCGIHANQRIRGEQVVDELDRITARRGYPKKIRVDNGPEFISKALDA